MDRVIIGIHGIGNKPPANMLHRWWDESIKEGLRKHNYKVPHFHFEMVYWADILHKSPLSPGQKDSRMPDFMEEQYVTEESPRIIPPGHLRSRAIEYLEKYYDRIIVNGVLSLENKTITELFIHLHMKDLESYYSGKSIEVNGVKRQAKDVIMERLADRLKKFRNKKIMLVAHSMGSIIAQDTLIEITRDINIDTLISIGSPLGQKYVVEKYNEELAQKSVNKLRVPDNVLNAWYNFADMEDQVAVNNRLAEIYIANKLSTGITDAVVKNNYSYNGNVNPHKSFGYLRTPEVAERINSFLNEGKTGMLSRIKELLSRLTWYK